MIKHRRQSLLHVSCVMCTVNKLQKLLRFSVLLPTVGKLILHHREPHWTGCCVALDRPLLQLAVGRLSHLLLAHAFTRWAEAAQELRALRDKAQQVLRATLRRRLRAALSTWQAYVEYRGVKHAMLAAAERQWRQTYKRRCVLALLAVVKVSTCVRW